MFALKTALERNKEIKNRKHKIAECQKSESTGESEGTKIYFDIL